jgi:hypothetical protein
MEEEEKIQLGLVNPSLAFFAPSSKIFIAFFAIKQLEKVSSQSSLG